MNPKKLVALTTAVILSTQLAACGDSSETSSNGTEVIKLEAGHVLAEDSPYHMALTEWAEEVKEATDGRIQITVFANSTLGNERDMVEAVQMGALDITLPNSAVLTNFTDSLEIFDLPFLLADEEEAYAVIDSPIGDGMLSRLQDIGIVGLSMWENGFRYIANNKHEIRTPEDMVGIKIRTMENAVHMQAFNTWGAQATTMAFGEVYTALQQGTVDALENPLTPIFQNRMQEVAPYITMTGHFYCPAPLIMAKATWEKISEEDQEILLELADKYKDIERRYCKETDGEYKQTMIEEGVTFVEAEELDKQQWRDAAQPVYDQYINEKGSELLDEIQGVIDEVNAKRGA